VGLVLGVIMSWRTVVIGSRSKLDFKMNYMIIRKDFEGIFEQSQEIFSDTINPTWYQMMIKEVTQLFAPML